MKDMVCLQLINYLLKKSPKLVLINVLITPRKRTIEKILAHEQVDIRNSEVLKKAGKIRSWD